jgi:gamma-glutamyltranspeptidase/glutathione hydrolase
MMMQSRRFTVAAVAAVVLVGAGAGFVVRGQDRGDAAAQGTMRAYRPSVPGTQLVTSAHPLASMAGAQILMQGGNAADAAVAVAAVLNVVEPQSSGLGGNGFVTYFDKATGAVQSLSMAGAAPKGVKSEAMTEQTLNRGITAAIVPGNLGGLVALLSRHGSLPLKDVLAPAIRYATDGHPIHSGLASGIAGSRAFFEKVPSSAAVFLPDGRAPEAGDLVKMPDYAATLTRLVEAEQAAVAGGASRPQALQAASDRFYKGDIAKEIAGFFAANGGVLSLEDLAAYAPQWTAPVRTSYRGYDIYSSPVTSRGGVEMVLQLNLLEGFPLPTLKAGTPETLHLVIESIKVAKADVYKYLGDPKFTSMPLAGLLSKDYAATRRALMNTAAAVPLPAPGNPHSFGTTSQAPRAAARAPGPAFP